MFSSGLKRDDDDDDDDDSSRTENVVSLQTSKKFESYYIDIYLYHIEPVFDFISEVNSEVKLVSLLLVGLHTRKDQVHL